MYVAIGMAVLGAFSASSSKKKAAKQRNAQLKRQREMIMRNYDYRDERTEEQYFRDTVKVEAQQLLSLIEQERAKDDTLTASAQTGSGHTRGRGLALSSNANAYLAILKKEHQIQDEDLLQGMKDKLAENDMDRETELANVGSNVKAPSFGSELGAAALSTGLQLAGDYLGNRLQNQAAADAVNSPKPETAPLKLQST